MSVLSIMAAVAWLGLGVNQQPQPQPEVTVYRTWRATDGMTVVEGMFRVDPDLLGTVGCSYEVGFAVRDADGNVLKRESWTGQCPQQDGRLAAALEKFQFAMPATKFVVEVTVFPQEQPERKRTAVVEVRGLSADPRASDLVLARQIGFIDQAGAPAAWTMRRGSIGLEVPSRIVLDNADPKLSFYLELYPRPERPMTGAVLGVVRRADGKELARTKVQTLDALKEPQPVAGTIPLAGLPAGKYTFEARVELADTIVVRAQPFEVASVVAQGNWFDTLSDAQVAESFDGVVSFGLTKNEIDLFRSLTTDGKRQFLARQFGPGGPTPDDGRDDALDAYLERIAHVKAFFAERSGRSTGNAWETARGRIWLRRGQPNSQMAKARPSSGAPYEIWQYATNPSYIYLFADESGMGHYRLIYTTDPDEQGVVMWEKYIAAEALDDLARFGVRPRADGGRGGGDSQNP